MKKLNADEQLFDFIRSGGSYLFSRIDNASFIGFDWQTVTYMVWGFLFAWLLIIYAKIKVRQEEIDKEISDKVNLAIQEKVDTFNNRITFLNLIFNAKVQHSVTELVDLILIAMNADDARRKRVKDMKWVGKLEEMEVIVDEIMQLTKQSISKSDLLKYLSLFYQKSIIDQYKEKHNVE
jgi:hypothetical protein